MLLGVIDYIRTYFLFREIKNEASKYDSTIYAGQYDNGLGFVHEDPNNCPSKIEIDPHE
jgi:hypothetical protein